MSPLALGKVLPAYNCAQEELYSVALLGWDSYGEQQALFLTKNTKYTVAYGTAQRTAVLAAKAMPDVQQRNSATQVVYLHLRNAGDAAMIMWKELEGLIISSFTVEEQPALLEQAGATHYNNAGQQDWEELSALMESGKTFIADFTAELTAGGMPATFAADFAAARTLYMNLFEEFKDSEQDNSEVRDAKVTANNELNRKLTEMFADGQKYFRNEPATRERFTFSKVLELVSGAGSQTITVDITEGGFVPVTGVIAGSAIVNTGAVAVLVCAGNAACGADAPITINAGEEAVNTLGSDISLTNTSDTSVAQCTVRVVQV